MTGYLPQSNGSSFGYLVYFNNKALMLGRCNRHTAYTKFSNSKTTANRNSLAINSPKSQFTHLSAPFEFLYPLLCFYSYRCVLMLSDCFLRNTNTYAHTYAFDGYNCLCICMQRTCWQRTTVLFSVVWLTM